MGCGSIYRSWRRCHRSLSMPSLFTSVLLKGIIPYQKLNWWAFLSSAFKNNPSVMLMDSLGHPCFYAVYCMCFWLFCFCNAYITTAVVVKDTKGGDLSELVQYKNWSAAHSNLLFSNFYFSFDKLPPNGFVVLQMERIDYY